MGWLIRHGRNTFLSNIAFIIFPFLKTFMATLLEDENWTSLNIQLNRSAQESPVIIQISFRYTKSRLKRKSFRRLFFIFKEVWSGKLRIDSPAPKEQTMFQWGFIIVFLCYKAVGLYHKEVHFRYTNVLVFLRNTPYTIRVIQSCGN